jgi:hypothetical protein
MNILYLLIGLCWFVVVFLGFVDSFITRGRSRWPWRKYFRFYALASFLVSAAILFGDGLPMSLRSLALGHALPVVLAGRTKRAESPETEVKQLLRRGPLGLVMPLVCGSVLLGIVAIVAIVSSFRGP